jgi:signal transduction histidine kinase
VTLIIPWERVEEERAMRRLRQCGERLQHFETFAEQDGRLINISVTIAPVRDAAGRVSGASKGARDSSAQKRAEAAVVEADRRKDEFLAVLAHELRNPLAPLQNAVEIVRASLDRPEVVAEFTTMMDRQIGHMKRLIDDLLDVSRITSGKLVLQRARIDLASVVGGAGNDRCADHRERSRAHRRSSARSRLDRCGPHPVVAGTGQSAEQRGEVHAAGR